MNLYFDTSALIKKYIDERGSDRVDELLEKADDVYISSILEIETISTFNRLLLEKAISTNDYKLLKSEFETDLQFFKIVNLDETIILKAKNIIEIYKLKSLDAIHLASAVALSGDADYFIVCDDKLIKSGRKEGLKIINPNV